MARPTLDQYMIGIAKLAATRTTCIRRGVGCVLTNERGHILAVGYNGVAAGMPHCNEAESMPVYHDDKRVMYNIARLSWEFNGKYSPRLALDPGDRQCVGFDEVYQHACKGHDLPPGQDSCEAVHAEQNALLQCRDPWAIGTAYVTLSPCKACMKLLLNTGCKRLVILEKHVDVAPLELWERSGRTWELMKGE